MTSALSKPIAKRDPAKIEPKRSTSGRREAVPTLCAFLNGKHGRVVVGIASSDELARQQVSEQAFHDTAREPFELEVESVKAASRHSAIVLTVGGATTNMGLQHSKSQRLGAECCA